jgi:hypothetical protein
VRVSIELWDVYQAWDGRTITKWVVMHGEAMLNSFVDHADAVAWVGEMGWEVEHDEGE